MITLSKLVCFICHNSKRRNWKMNVIELWRAKHSSILWINPESKTIPCNILILTICNMMCVIIISINNPVDNCRSITMMCTTLQYWFCRSNFFEYWHSWKNRFIYVSMTYAGRKNMVTITSCCELNYGCIAIIRSDICYFFRVVTLIEIKGLLFA